LAIWLGHKEKAHLAAGRLQFLKKKIETQTRPAKPSRDGDEDGDVRSRTSNWSIARPRQRAFNGKRPVSRPKQKWCKMY
jgi:hypothetical protein